MVNLALTEPSETVAGHESGDRIIRCGEQLYQLQPGSYWYLASSTMGLLRHYVSLSEGICSSISMIASLPALDGSVPHFGLRLMSEEKENAWESIRLLTDPRLPSRRHSALLFDDESIAREAATRWFAPEVKHVLDVRIVWGTKLHLADARWLECDEERWHDHAQAYWTGEMTNDPLPEVLVDGLVYFPSWRRPPFRLIRGLWTGGD
ncbi:MAG: hypothetical protein U1F33_01310 [Alphaproteobacteria bacterium]